MAAAVMRRDKMPVRVTSELYLLSVTDKPCDPPALECMINTALSVEKQISRLFSELELPPHAYTHACTPLGDAGPTDRCA